MTDYGPSAHGVRKAIAEAIPEASIQDAIVELLQAHGWLVIETSMHQRVEGDMIGVPDILALRNGIAWFIECKTIKGKLRASQKEFAQLLKPSLCATIWYTVARSVDDVMAQMPDLGFAAFAKGA